MKYNGFHVCEVNEEPVKGSLGHGSYREHFVIAMLSEIPLPAVYVMDRRSEILQYFRINKVRKIMQIYPEGFATL